MNKLVILEQARRMLMNEYHYYFSWWLETAGEFRRRLATFLEDLVARIELVDAYIKREISA